MIYHSLGVEQNLRPLLLVALVEEDLCSNNTCKMEVDTMRVSKLLWALSLAVLVLAFFISTPGTVRGADPWDELNASNDNGGVGGADGSEGTGSMIDPSVDDGTGEDGEFILMGTTGFWWELLFGEDPTGVNSTESNTTDGTTTEGATSTVIIMN